MLIGIKRDINRTAGSKSLESFWQLASGKTFLDNHIMQNNRPMVLPEAKGQKPVTFMKPLIDLSTK
jgi:hypothetical protein